MNGLPMVNVDLSTPTESVVPTPAGSNTSNLCVGTSTATPLTPEILNSVMAMTNPLEYSFPLTVTSHVSTKVSQVRWSTFNFQLFLANTFLKQKNLHFYRWINHCCD